LARIEAEVFNMTCLSSVVPDDAPLIAGDVFQANYAVDCMVRRYGID
jgi:hypothetical protein